MNHTITVGDFLCGFGVIIGVTAIMCGVLMVTQALMSDGPTDASASKGCVSGIIGIVLLCVCIWGLFS